jgi:hypothetical protein
VCRSVKSDPMGVLEERSKLITSRGMPNPEDAKITMAGESLASARSFQGPNLPHKRHPLLRSKVHMHKPVPCAKGHLVIL